MQPYTYLIGWSKQNLWYYGAQYGKKANPDKLWITYYTSSKYVKSARVLFGEPDIIKIRKKFNCAKQCKRWETKVLRRMNVVSQEIWLNKTISDGYPIPQKGIRTREIGYKHSEETKQKISTRTMGKLKGPCSEERRTKLKKITKEKRYNYNTKKYSFNHKNGDIYSGTVIEFCEKYNLFKTNVYNMIYGKTKSVKGWKLTIELNNT